MAGGFQQAGDTPGEPHSGQRLGNRYELRQRLKTGRGISTWQGLDLLTRERLLVKVTSLSAFVPTARHRLEHEAEVLSRLHAPALVPVRHLGTFDDLLYLVTPWIEGETLEARLLRGPLSLPEAITLGQRLLEALAEAHHEGVLHRDVKPSNVLVRDHPLSSAWLTDFGLARSERLDPSLRDLPVGTARYLSPEQAGLLNRPVETPSDLYAVGLVLFEALSGRPALEGTSVGEVLRLHLDSHPRLRAVGVEVPLAMEELIARLSQTDPRDRYQSAEAALADLNALEAALSRGEAEPALVTGAHDHRQSLTEPSFVGRREELATLERELAHASTEGARGVVVEGESGGGKSRLLEEFSARATGHRAWVLHGQAQDQAAQRPFQLFAGVADGIAQAVEEQPALGALLRERLAGQEAGLCTVLPRLTEVLSPGMPQPQTQGLGPESLSESRSIWCLTALLNALGTKEAPAVVVLEDCQWADALTLRALEAWSQGRRPAEGRLLLLVSFRSEDIPAGHLLRRLAPSSHIKLSAFGAAEVARLAESMAGVLPPEAVELVTRLSEGNPFMASAVLHGLVEDGVLVPGPAGWQVQPEAMAHARSSRQAATFLVRRLRLLPPESLHVLSVGAVLGKAFDARAVAALSGTPLEAVNAALDPPRRRHMLWMEGTRSTFVHDKLREVLLDLLSPEERRELHRLAARAAAQNVPTDPFELAYHFDAAGEPAQALPYALVAAEQARQRFALDTAELNYRIAERGAAGADPHTRYRIASGLGTALMMRGRYDEAQQQLESAQRLARDRLEQGRTLGHLGELAFKRGQTVQANAYLEQGLKLMGRWVPLNGLTTGASAAWEILTQAAHSVAPRLWLGRKALAEGEEDMLAVNLYSRLAYGYWYQRGRAAVLWAHLRDMNLAERYPPTPELAQAYSAHSPALTTLPWFQRAYAYAEKSLALRRQLGDVWGQGQSLHFYGLALYASSRFRECIERCREAVRLLERTGDPWEVNNATFQIAMSLYRLGRLKEAAGVSQRLHAAALALGDRYSLRLGLEAWAKSTGGRIPAALLEVELAAPTATDPQSFAGVLQAEALRLLREGEVARAAEVLERAERVVEDAHLRQEYVAPITPWLATARRQLAQESSPLNPKRRDALLAEAEAVAKRAHAVARTYRNNLPHALRERGLLAALRGRPKQARKLLNESLRVAEALEMRQERALTLKARGDVGKALGWPWAARDAETAARDLEALDDGLQAGPGTSAGVGTLSLVDRFPRVLDAGRRLASALSREAVFEAARQSMVELLRAERCAVVDPRVLVSEEDAKSQGLSRTALARALETGRISVMGQGLPGGISESMELLGVRSLLCAPLQVRGKTVACVVASHRKVGALFGEDEERLASFVAVLAGAALENTENFERIAALSEEQGRLYREEQEAVRRRDDFLSIAAHELKTPLTSLQLHIQGLQAKAKGAPMSPEKLSTKLESAYSQTQRLGKLVNDLLDISRIAQGQLHIKREDVDLVALVRGQLERSRESLARAECEVRFHATQPRFVGHWDALRLEQVVGNLLTNAMKYGAGKPVEITLDGDASRVRLLVRDHGIGIAKEDRARIFERFERAVSVRHYGGFGLGLWIVREIVQALGGGIDVASAPEQGSTFTVTLPRSGGPVH
ncbi:GAF domain-containing sensor histidine kinase [Corallococcus llansteffanensis]|uniref:histidine kinase n=1 Tax=Corallococcus llansteffanensis TaxID=2316731 RepID=A0A3A8PRK3_9BACT|nr:ATP-binding protein [Corallococcus llansteffanensis]RKH57451.1 GAF domain-containing protein [Corallococcus llansteffanensis]